MNRTEWVTQALRRLRDALPSQREISTATIGLYAEALEDISEEALTVAFARCARECAFFPVPAEIRRLAGITPELSPERRASLAWDETREHARGKLGNGMDSVLFADPFAAAAIRSVFGSWEAQCIAQDVERHRREWERVYVAKVIGGLADYECGSFPGDIESNCRSRGVALPSPLVASSRLPQLPSAPASHRACLAAASAPPLRLLK